MRKKSILLETTTSRSEFNRAYKSYLEKIGKIRCSYCPYHGGENSTKKWYGGFEEIRYPNWKLVSKNRKQWMKKPTKITKEKNRWNNREYVNITW